MRGRRREVERRGAKREGTDQGVSLVEDGRSLKRARAKKGETIATHLKKEGGERGRMRGLAP